MLDKAIDLMHEASATLPRATFKRHLKPYWGKDLTVQSRRSKEAKKAWKASGGTRDETNPLWTQYKEQKRTFRRQQRAAERQREMSYLAEIEESADIDQAHFWALINETCETSLATN